MYVQMEFDFTFNCFCEIVDEFSNEVVCAGREECFFDPATSHYYPNAKTLEEHAMYDCTPVCNETCRKPKINYSKYRIRRQKKVANCMTLLWQADNQNLSYKDFVKNWEVL